MIKKCYYILLLVSVHALAQEQKPLTLEEAVQLALENNYGIQIARNEVEIAENNVTLGNAGFLPLVEGTFNQNYGVSSFEQQLNSGDERADDGVQNSRRTYDAALNWTVFDGMRMFHAYDQLQSFKELSEDQLRAAVETTVFNLTMTFYQVGLENERLRLLESNLSLSEERMAIAKDKYELGKASKLEYLQAQVDYNTDKSTLIAQREVLASTKYDLLRIMADKRDSASFEVDYELRINDQLLYEDLLNNLESSNPQLLTIRKTEIIARQDEDIVKAERLPTISLFADYSHQSFESPANFAVEGTSDNLNYGLSARITLFNGFNLNRRIQNSFISSESAQLEYEQQLLNFETDLKQTYINYQNNLNLLVLEKENLAVARENNEIAKDRYEIGLSSAIELREAQLNFINAELRERNAAFAAKFAEIQLEFLAGISLINN